MTELELINDKLDCILELEKSIALIMISSAVGDRQFTGLLIKQMQLTEQRQKLWVTQQDSAETEA